jgi:hypothetical protein
MGGLVSGIIRRSVILWVKNEEGRQRVKRRRVVRKRHFEDVWVGESVAKPASYPASCAVMIFDYFTGTVWRIS